MLARLKNWLRNRFGEEDGPLDSYSPRERRIFTYFDGAREVRADPLELYKKVMAVGPQLNIDIKLSRSASKDARLGHDGMVVKLRGVFGVKAFDQGGLTQGELIDLFDQFMSYCSSHKKKVSPSPTPAAGTRANSASSSDAGPATGSSSDSGSTGPVRATAGQTPSPSGPGSPTTA